MTVFAMFIKRSLDQAISEVLGGVTPVRLGSEIVIKDSKTGSQSSPDVNMT